MSRTAVDETEHRRGLVLGLTLAEALLLLLFLLLLGLATVIEETEQKRRALEEERDQLAKTVRTVLKTGADGATSTVDLAKELGTANTTIVLLKEQNEKLQRENSDLLKELSAMFPAGVHKADVDRVLEQAIEIDKSAPVEFLERAVDVLMAVGHKMTPEQARELVKAAKANGEHDWPPIIEISGAGKHFFQSGSPDLPPGLQTLLSGSVTEQLLAMISKYRVDVIEVVGHTDEQPIILRASDLDRTLLPYLRRQPVPRVTPADNAGLGLARAVSVARQLSSDPRLKGYQILPLSGGQLIDLKDRVSTGQNPLPAEYRRRIEIRLRRPNGEIVKADSGGSVQQLLGSEQPQPWRQFTRPATDSLRPISGPASIVDGDTVDIGDDRIRLWGVDAIEQDQKCFDAGQEWDCAAEATIKLHAYLDGKTVVCEPVDRDRDNRVVARCTVDGVDVGSWLVSGGLAIDYPRYSKGRYIPEETEAKSLGLGIWRGEFMLPWEWRKARGSTGAVQ